MAIDAKSRKRLVEILDGVDYRKIVSERTGCHPNTVTNVLNGNDNPVVELAILTLAQEQKPEKQSQDDIRKKNR
jgi:hypothetical protein